MLAVIETHPIQYHAPLYRALQMRFGIPVTTIYGSDFSVAGYRDAEFGVTFAWDTDLLSGYTSQFLSRASGMRVAFDGEVRARGLDTALQRLKPRAVMVVGYSPRFHQVAFYRAWRAGVPIVFRGETTDHAARRGAVRGYLRTHALRWMYERCARLLYVGQRSYRHFRRLGCSDEKLVFSPYCVDASSFECGEGERDGLRSATREGLGFAAGERVLLFSGKLSPRKGPDLILLAVKELPSEVRERVRVLFLGSGELAAELADLAQRPPPVAARFVGFQNQSRLSPYYHAADLLVLPSRHSETWGLVVNEALHHGLPCVVSEAVGCALDLIEPGVTGEICETGSPLSLAAAMQRALASLVGRAEVRAKCREKVAGYSVEKGAEGIAQAYWDVVSPPLRIGERA